MGLSVACIPARGGSRRIPRKNIKLFRGKPVIAYSIEAALKSGCFDQVVVSTDDDEIAEVARKYGAQTPFVRPLNLSDEYCAIGDVNQHCFDWFLEQGTKIARLCCIYATAPMISHTDIKKGGELLDANQTAREALSVTSFPFPIQRAHILKSDGFLTMLHPEYRLTRSQDLEETFQDAGHFIWINYEVSVSNSKGCLPVYVDRFRVQDIDTREDWIQAEYLHAVLQNRQEIE